MALVDEWEAVCVMRNIDSLPGFQRDCSMTDIHDGDNHANNDRAGLRLQPK